MPFDTQVSSATKLSSIQFLNILISKMVLCITTPLYQYCMWEQSCLQRKMKQVKLYRAKAIYIFSFQTPREYCLFKNSNKRPVCKILCVWQVVVLPLACRNILVHGCGSRHYEKHHKLFVRWVFVEQEEVTWVPTDRSNFFITVHSSVQFLHQACFLSSHS